MPLGVPQRIHWEAAQFPTAAQFNTVIRDAFSFLAAKTVLRAHQSVTQSVANNSNAILNLDVLDEDTYSGWTSGASNKYTAQVDGNYLVTVCYCSNGGNGAGNVAKASVQVNSNLYEGAQLPIPTTTGWQVPAAYLVYAKTGDTIQPIGFQTSGAALSTFVSGIGQTSYMEITWATG